MSDATPPTYLEDMTEDEFEVAYEKRMWAQERPAEDDDEDGKEEGGDE